VIPTSRLNKALVPALRRAGYRVITATTFDSAKAQLSTGTDLLITELKLGEYNGLQLALRGRASGIPAIVIADSSYEQEIERLGAIWISPEGAASEELQVLVANVLQQWPLGQPPHAWPDDVSQDLILPPTPTAFH
jgi:DNA-binding NtrC family response regulator